MSCCVVICAVRRLKRSIRSLSSLDRWPRPADSMSPKMAARLSFSLWGMRSSGIGPFEVDVAVGHRDRTLDGGARVAVRPDPPAVYVETPQRGGGVALPEQVAHVRADGPHVEVPAGARR